MTRAEELAAITVYLAAGRVTRIELTDAECAERDTRAIRAVLGLPAKERQRRLMSRGLPQRGAGKAASAR